MADEDGPKYTFTNFAELLPDNERTHDLLKKRAEEEEIRR